MSSCDQCGHDNLAVVYAPDRSSRGLKVFLCRHCGLAQSLPRIARIMTVVFTRAAGGRLSRCFAISCAVGISSSGSTRRLMKPSWCSRSAVNLSPQILEKDVCKLKP